MSHSPEFALLSRNIPLLQYTLAVKRSWLTRPLLFVPIKVQQAFLLFAAVFIVLVLFAPGLCTLTWHVLHGNSLIYKTKKIPVPMRWTAESELQAANIEKLALAIFPSDKPIQAIISLRVIPAITNPTHKGSSESFEAVYRTYLAGDRAVTGPVKVLSGPDEGVCMEAAAKNGSEGLEITCLVFQEGWTVSLLGTKKERSEFYDILNGIH